MRAGFLRAFLILPMYFGLVQCEAPQSARTDVGMAPWPDFAKFTIASPLPPQDLTETLYALFQQHPELSHALPCHRYGPGNSRFACLKVISEDVFSTRFEPDLQTLTFSIAPRTFDPGYRPDYGHFERLKMEIAGMLAGHFGQANVSIK